MGCVNVVDTQSCAAKVDGESASTLHSEQISNTDRLAVQKARLIVRKDIVAKICQARFAGSEENVVAAVTRLQ